MPDMPLDDGSRPFDHLHCGYATEFVSPDGPAILIRPDGYIGYIGSTRCNEHAGESVRRLRQSWRRIGQ
jgi:hypothetical protein